MVPYIIFLTYARIILGADALNQAVFGIMIGLTIVFCPYYLLRSKITTHVEALLADTLTSTQRWNGLINASCVWGVAVLLNLIAFVYNDLYFLMPDTWWQGTPGCNLPMKRTSNYMYANTGTWRVNICYFAYLGLHTLRTRGIINDLSNDGNFCHKSWRFGLALMTMAIFFLIIEIDIEHQQWRAFIKGFLAWGFIGFVPFSLIPMFVDSGVLTSRRIKKEEEENTEFRLLNLKKAVAGQTRSMKVHKGITLI